jgi:hypothetical protein
VGPVEVFALLFTAEELAAVELLTLEDATLAAAREELLALADATPVDEVVPTLETPALLAAVLLVTTELLPTETLLLEAAALLALAELVPTEALLPEAAVLVPAALEPCALTPLEDARATDLATELAALSPPAPPEPVVSVAHDGRTRVVNKPSPSRSARGEPLTEESREVGLLERSVVIRFSEAALSVRPRKRLTPGSGWTKKGHVW